ncbi:VOC family protein, partial [Burkholderia pseudomallei]
ALQAAPPRADTVREQLVWLNAAPLLELDAGETPALAADFDTPRGARTLR